MTVEKRKRPLEANGDKAQKKSNRGIPEEVDLDSANALKVDLEEDEKDDELAELYGLFKTFEAAGKDRQRLAHGIIHECDTLLRVRQELPARFHFVYGATLLALAEFQEPSPSDPDSSGAFIGAALERLERGIEEVKSDTARDQANELHALQAIYALALVNKVEDQICLASDEERESVALASVSKIKEARELVTKAYQSANRNDKYVATAMAAAVDFALSLDAFQNKEVKKLQQDILFWAQGISSALQRSDESSAAQAASKALGHYYLSLASGFLAELEEDVDDDDDEEDDDDESDSDEGEEGEINEKLTTSEAEAARENVSKAIAFFVKAHADADPQLYVQTAEALISLGNLKQVNSEGQKQDYKKAVKLLKKAQRLGAGSFHDLIESLE